MAKKVKEPADYASGHSHLKKRRPRREPRKPRKPREPRKQTLVIKIDGEEVARRAVPDEHYLIRPIDPVLLRQAETDTLAEKPRPSFWRRWTPWLFASLVLFFFWLALR